MIRDLGKSIGRTVLDGIGRAASRLQETRALSADLLESEDAYLAIFDAPGATADDVGVRFEDNTLSVRIDRFRAFHDGYEMVFPGRGLALTGAVTLPDGAAVDADEADATLTQSGTLEVLIPKTALSDDDDDEASSAQDVEEPTELEADDASEPSEETPDAR